TAEALAANSGNAIVLSAGQSFTFSVTRTLTLDAKDGSYTNVVTATGKDDENNTVSDDDTHTATVTDVAPVITIDKVGPGTIAEGNTATYSFTITNGSVSTDTVTITKVV